jgi:hypothetical protein
MPGAFSQLLVHDAHLHRNMTGEPHPSHLIERRGERVEGRIREFPSILKFTFLNAD